MVDRRRHAPTGRYRNPKSGSDSRGLPHVFRGRARRTYSDVYDRDLNGGGFRWLISTCIAATVGALVIAVVIFGSLDNNPSFDNVLDRLSDAQRPAPRAALQRERTGGLNWAMPKSDQLEIASGALSARYTIHEQANVRRNNRPFIEIRPYLRVVARLAPASQKHADVIPPLNPFNLYATKADGPAEEKTAGKDNGSGRVAVRMVELLGGILPGDDGRQLDAQQVRNIVQQLQAPEPPAAAENPLERTGLLPAGLTPAYLTTDSFGSSQLDLVDPNITVIRKTVLEEEDADDGNNSSETRVVRVGRGDNISRILQRMGAPDWLSGAMIEAAGTVVSMNKITPGQEIHVRMVPSLTQPGQMEPAGFTVFGAGHNHIVTVKRDAGGEFKASAEIDRTTLLRTLASGGKTPRSNNLYSAIYDAGLTQSLSPEKIMKIMRIHAYETDFRRRLRNGDQVEWFFELRPQTQGKPKLGELLYTAITTSGERNQFWRFRSRDGHVDYYDNRGHNSKKFLMRKPVRGNNIRLTSGFGFRRHPILKQRRMHTGVDWAGPRGTPILAAGKGVIEYARRRGANGNYVRIRHANGYQTSYSHMHRFGPGIREGIKVKQGQVIGYIGSTGLSSGPHLHYEILVNKRHVNPLKIKVPRERRLTGTELAAYKRERQRINDLLKRPPVETKSQ